MTVLFLIPFNLNIILQPRICNSFHLQLSYPGHCQIDRARPIFPCAPSLLGEGHMQTITTQKHDYVNKPVQKLSPIRPQQNLYIPNCPSEKETIFRLSYSCPGKVETKSFKPIMSFGKPNGKILI